MKSPKQKSGPNSQTEEQRDEAKRVEKRWDTLDTASSSWKSHWQDCYENIVPRKEDVLSNRQPGDRRNSDLYDTTAILANEMLASALHGMLTNPETRFFEMSFGDPALDENEEVKKWCQESGDRMFRVLNNSNFQTEIYEVYIDLGAIGTAAMYMGEHKDNVIHFSARGMKEIRVDENSLGLIDVVYRMFKMRPRQIIKEFGKENVPDEVIMKAEKGSEDYLEIIHAVEPMSDTEIKQNPKKHKFKSTYELRSKKWILSVDGFREFPYAVPRWSKTTGEVYGRGPGMSMLPDIMMVNAMMLTTLKGAQKTVDPPLMVQDDGVIGQVRLTPGGLTIVRPGSEMIKPLITDARIDFGYKAVEDVRQRIRAGFYVDQFQLAQGPQKTAEEVKQEVEQKLRLMGPVLGRQHFELLKPVIERTFGIMSRKGLIEPAPQAIRGKSFDVRYSSLIARAQRMSEGQNMMRAVQTLAPLFQVKPESLQLLDADAHVRYIYDVNGLKSSLLLPKREVEKLRKAQAQMQQQAMQQQQEQHQAEVAGKVAPAITALKQGGNNNASGQ
jgi:hypothetical protein